MSVKPKRVLFVATVVKTHIMTFHIPFLKMFKEMGYETAVAARNDYEDPEDCRIPYCDHFYDVPFQREPFHLDNFKCYKKLKAIIDEGEFSIIHCHTPVGGVLGRLAARNARRKNVRIMYTAHGFHFYKGAPLKNWLLYYPVEKLCAYFTDVLITINREDFALAQRKMRAKSVQYVPGVGIDLEKFGVPAVDKAAKRREQGIPEDAVLLLSVGELNSNKNHETVIRAIAEQELYYIIAGKGALQPPLQSLIDSLGISHRVKLLGYRTDVKELYEAADLFVFPSFREGLSVSVMEAMASGLPCVASRIRGNTDLLGDSEGGLLCQPNDPADFADKISRLAADPQLRCRMGHKNRAAVEKFGMESVIRQMQDIYTAALQK